MNNYTFLQTYFELQKGIAIDELFDLDFAEVCFSHNDPSSFWNNALVNDILVEEKISIIEEKLRSLKRNPAFYYENRSDLADLTSLLQQHGYSQSAEDSWMFHNGNNIDETNFNLVRKVANENELEIFLDILNKSYRKDDPLNPYGELSEYLKSARKAWEDNHSNNRVEYFIVYKGGKHVAVSTLTNHDGIGYISNVGSLIAVRGEGFGKLATMYCVSVSKKNGNTTHCLATEENTNPNEFYNALGFKTQFRALLMEKKR